MSFRISPVLWCNQYLIQRPMYTSCMVLLYIVLYRDPDSKDHGAHLGPTGPRWAPCWPHDACYLRTHLYCTLPLPFTDSCSLTTHTWTDLVSGLLNTSNPISNKYRANQNRRIFSDNNVKWIFLTEFSFQVNFIRICPTNIYVTRLSFIHLYPQMAVTSQKITSIFSFTYMIYCDGMPLDVSDSKYLHMKLLYLYLVWRV